VKEITLAKGPYLGPFGDLGLDEALTVRRRRRALAPRGEGCYSAAPSPGMELLMARLLLLIALLVNWQGIAGAAELDYPTRPVRFIVPFGPASGTDIAARLFADRLAARWGKPVLVENRPGGDGLVAITAFTGAGDDHTLLFAPVGTFAVHPYEHAKLPYDAARDLLPIASISTIVLAVSASESLKIGSLGELVSLVRAQPGKLNAAAANGNANFLLFGFLKSSGLQVAKVPYRDILQAPNDLAEGRIDLLMTSLAVVQPQMQAGRIKVLAVTGRTRAPSAPEVPTAVEAGYPALELESLVGVFGPRGMPVELREYVADGLRSAAAADPVISTRLAATGQIVAVRGPDEFAAGIAALRAKLAATAETLGIRSAQ
jgi:tripartite-type tricarboxylate transporter receptor subunit TctC